MMRRTSTASAAITSVLSGSPCAFFMVRSGTTYPALMQQTCDCPELLSSHFQRPYDVSCPVMHGLSPVNWSTGRHWPPLLMHSSNPLPALLILLMKTTARMTRTRTASAARTIVLSGSPCAFFCM